MKKTVEKSCNSVQSTPGSYTAELIAETSFPNELLAYTRDMSVHLAKDGTIRWLSEAASGLLGYTPAQMTATQVLHYVADEDRERAILANTTLLAGDAGRTALRAKLTAKDGSSVWLDAACYQHTFETGEHGILVVLADATACKLNELELQRRLHEQQHLLREVQHRVKNNLQIMSSLLNLQLEAAPAQAAPSLRATQGRLRSMSLVHEALYESSQLSSLHLATYIQRLLAQLRQLYQPDSLRLEVSLNVREKPVHPDRAVTLGLLLNELITNSLCHAYTGRTAGQLNITVTDAGDTTSILIADDGPGIDNVAAATDSLGLRIVYTLCEQLRATLTIDGSSGTAVQVVLPAAALQP